MSVLSENDFFFHYFVVIGFGEVVNHGRVLPENDPTWKAGGTTLQGYSSQHFTTADPIKVDSSKKVELLLRLVARYDVFSFIIINH